MASHFEIAQSSQVHAKPSNISRFPVFIVGSPRSGTSVLVEALRSAGYRGFREGNFLSLISAIDQAVERHYKSFDNGHKDVLISNVDRLQIKKRMFDILKTATDERHIDAPWLDKTGNPEIISAIPVLRTLWRDSVFIFAKRRAIENIVSRLKKFPKHPFEYHCRDWARNMSTWRMIRGELPSDIYEEVDQQDMIQRPKYVATRLAALLRMGSAQEHAIEDVLRRSRPQQSEPDSADRRLALTSTGWSDQQRELFLKHCEAEMLAYGYSMDARYAS